MEELERFAVLAALIQELNGADNWTGETHVQKAAYIAETIGGVNLGHDFILYKHGPYSFDLSDDIVSMLGYHVIDMKPRRPYGPTLVPDKNAGQLFTRFGDTVERNRPVLRRIAQRLGNRGVVEMEAIATALYVSLEMGWDSDPKALNRRVRELKPHLDQDQVDEGLSVVRGLHDEIAAPEQAGMVATA